MIEKIIIMNASTNEVVLESIHIENCTNMLVTSSYCTFSLIQGDIVQLTNRKDRYLPDDLRDHSCIKLIETAFLLPRNSEALAVFHQWHKVNLHTQPPKLRILSQAGHSF